jgi:transcriptional antiterminator NusG
MSEEENVEVQESAVEPVAGDVANTETAPADAEAVENPRFKWYVVHTYSGHENKVKQSIEKAVELHGFGEQFGQVLIPMEEVTEMKKGKKVKINKKFFPSYVLVQLELNEEMMHLVNNIPGVTRFVGTGSRPVPVTDKEVDRILKRGDKGIFGRETPVELDFLQVERL